MAELIKSTFSDWTLDSLKTVFDIKRVDHHPILHNWLSSAQNINITDMHQSILVRCKKAAQLSIEHLNGEEVKREIISPILSIIQFIIPDKDNNKIVVKFFASRELKGVMGIHEMSGYSDGLIAKGATRPKVPYFCRHTEYDKVPMTIEECKKQENLKDGLGQLIAAMLVAQTLNTKKRPIYGAYILGRNWFFVVLEKQEYTISNAYDVTKDEIFDIYRILQQLKLYVIQFLEEDKDLP